MKYLYLFYLVASLSPFSSSAQTFSKQQIWDGLVDKLWLQDGAGYMRLALPGDETSMEFSMITFRSNGSFHERRKTTCGKDRQIPYSGAWRISGDTVIVATHQGPMFHYKITGIGTTAVKYE
ncbi:MAG TPA: hypothetical protein VEB40_00725 [Flavipsychrobacter sp.]|nr:hypothetical protein [Flavipsychrobacter sp.]